MIVPIPVLFLSFGMLADSLNSLVIITIMKTVKKWEEGYANIYFDGRMGNSIEEWAIPLLCEITCRYLFRVHAGSFVMSLAFCIYFYFDDQKIF